MVDSTVVASKLRELADRIARIRSHCPPSPEELAADRDALDLVSFNLMLAVQTCLDIASHLIADESWEPVASLAESFRRLAERGVLSESTAAALGKAAGLRNLVAHGYAVVEPGRIHAAARDGVADLERFAREVGAWLTGRAAGSPTTDVT
jgi:uncharacterized protein YutE (UPF0331/DUF86 family)